MNAASFPPTVLILLMVDLVQKREKNIRKLRVSEDNHLVWNGYYGNCAFLSSPVAHLESHIFVGTK